MVWQGRRTYNGSFTDTIFFKDISSPGNPVQVLVERSAHQSSPVISGNMVIWFEGGTVKQIHYTYIENGCPSSGSCIDHVLPISTQARPYVADVYKDDVRNMVVWEDWRGGTRQKDIYMYDLNAGQEQVVCNATSNQERPSIGADWIAYSDNRGGTYTTFGIPTKNDIWARNISTWEERRITFDERTIIQSGATISGNNLAFTGSGIWFYDFANPVSPRQIAASGQRPAIDGNIIAYEVSSGSTQIDMHDLGTSITQHVSTGQSLVLYAAVSGSYVVWSDDRDGVRNLYHNRVSASSLAAKYQPELHVAEDDYMPTLVDLMTDLNYGDTRFRVWHGSEIDEEMNAYHMINYGSLATYTNSNINYPISQGWDFDLDLGGSRIDGDRHINDYRYWRNNVSGAKGKYPVTVYARVALPEQILVNPEGKTVIQYWLCYYYNDFPADDFKHEGDWEMVQVDLSDNLVPERVVTSRHGFGKYRDWGETDKVGDRPVVYVAEGTHANYFTPDRQMSTDVNVIGTNFDDPADSLIAEEPDLRLIDSVDTSWLDYYGFWGEKESAPRGPIYNDMLAWGDPLNWGGKISKEIYVTDAITAYAEKLPGVGAQSGILATQSAAFTSGTNPASVSISLTDSLNRRTGIDANGVVHEEIPNSEFVSWTDGSGNAVIYSTDIGQGYTVEVENQGSDLVNVKLNLPVFAQNSTDQPDYNITVPGPLKGRVVVAAAGSAQDYMMYLDTDDDGIFDDGAVTPAIAQQSVDFISPGQINNLSVGSIGPGSATLTWTAPGDDGNIGTATEYDIRYSSSAIVDEYSWSHAEIVSGVTTPQPGGSGELLSVEGLKAGSYYFVISAKDEVNHESVISNSVSAILPAYYFEDNFEDGNADGWTAQDPPSWSVGNVAGNFLYTATASNPVGSWSGPSGFTDQFLEADVSVNGGSTAGLLFRGSGDIVNGSYYYFGIYPGEGKWKLFSVKSGWWGDESNNPEASGDYLLNSGTTYRLRASAQGEAISLYINGQGLIGGDIAIPDNPSGKFGLYSDSSVAVFDNVIAGQAGS
ncbi:MAG: hypothetical protein ACYC6O_08575 [Thermoleophilia bacterium]